MNGSFFRNGVPRAANQVNDNSGTWRSCAEWPEGTLCASADQITRDTNGPKSAALAICTRLQREGFGGDRKIFPVRVWVERVEA